MLIILFLLNLLIVLSITFTDIKYEDLQIRSLELHGLYAISKTAKELYNIDPAKANSNGNEIQCSPYIIRVTDIASIEQNKQRPQTILRYKYLFSFNIINIHLIIVEKFMVMSVLVHQPHYLLLNYLYGVLIV